MKKILLALFIAGVFILSSCAFYTNENSLPQESMLSDESISGLESAPENSVPEESDTDISDSENSVPEGNDTDVSNSGNTQNYITERDARHAAIGYLTQQGVTGFRSDSAAFDSDNLVYLVTVKTKENMYRVKVNAIAGTIISWETDDLPEIIPPEVNGQVEFLDIPFEVNVLFVPLLDPAYAVGQNSWSGVIRSSPEKLPIGEPIAEYWETDKGDPSYDEWIRKYTDEWFEDNWLIIFTGNRNVFDLKYIGFHFEDEKQPKMLFIHDESNLEFNWDGTYGVKVFIEIAKKDIPYDIGGTESEFFLVALNLEHAEYNGYELPESSDDVSEKLISEDTALEKAVVKANVDSGEILNIKIELEYDNGEWQYEIEFEDAHYEYKVTIDAETGSSLDYERGWNEKYRNPAFLGTTGNIYAFKMRIKPSGMGIFIFQEVYEPMEPWFGYVDGSYGEPSFNDWITKYTDEWFEENRLFVGELIADGQIEIVGIYEKFGYSEKYDHEYSTLLLVYNQLTEEERVYEEDGSFYGYYFLLELPKEDYPEEHFTDGTGNGTKELP